MQLPQMGYDRAITVFSPDGRLFQVEYAREAVKRGATAIGVKTQEGVLLLADRRVASKLLELETVEKIYKIDEHIGAATSGLVSDARVLIDKARIEAQVNKLWYNEAITTKELAKKICDFKQTYTQYGGVRPFGTSLLIAGVDESPRLFETDPSGALLEYKATSIGSGRNVVMDYFESNYREDISMEEGINLAMIGLGKAIESELTPDGIELGVVYLEDRKFRAIEDEELQKYVDTANETIKQELAKVK
jgi:proteasome alpha subunit